MNGSNAVTNHSNQKSRRWNPERREMRLQGVLCRVLAILQEVAFLLHPELSIAVTDGSLMQQMMP